jgi:hypothetical protein
MQLHSTRLPAVNRSKKLLQIVATTPVERAQAAPILIANKDLSRGPTRYVSSRATNAEPVVRPTYRVPLLPKFAKIYILRL